MNPMPPRLKILLYVMGSILVMNILSIVFDITAYRDNEFLDGQPGFTDKEHERYQFQAVEAYIAGHGMGIAALIGLIGWWLHENNGRGRP